MGPKMGSPRTVEVASFASGAQGDGEPEKKEPLVEGWIQMLFP